MTQLKFITATGKPTSAYSAKDGTEPPTTTPNNMPTSETPPISENLDALAKFEECLRIMPKAGQGIGFNDQALPRAARLAQLAGVPQDEAVRLILETQKGAARDTEDEIRSTVERIFQDDGSERRRRKRKPDWPNYDPALVATLSQGEAKSVNDLIRLSPEQGLAERRPFEFLKSLLPESLVTLAKKVVLTEPASGANPAREIVTYRAETLVVTEPNAHKIDAMEYFVPSPAIRRLYLNKDGTKSHHCGKMYGARYYLVIESDTLSKDQAAGVLIHLSQFAPLILVVDSGGKSLHGFFDCAGVPEPMVEQFFAYAHRLGADPALMKVMQFARLPNGTRLGGARQTVLYFDPSAKGRPWDLTKIPGSSMIPRSIFEIPDENEADSNLLGDLFLCRGKGILLPAPTGVGKSTLVMQASVLFAAGRDFFGIRPTKPLRILIVQAENDSKELQDMVVGALTGAKLTDQEEQLVRKNLFYVTMNGVEEWLEKLEPFVEQLQPDIVVIDPLLAFFNGNVSEQAAMSPFLRAKIQPFLEKHRIGLIAVHHTNKPATSKKDRPEWQGSDFAYFGSGSSELGNWFKAVVALRSTGHRDVFELIIGKRHRRAGLRDKDGNLTDRVLIKHSPATEPTYWELADENDLDDTKRDDLIQLGKAYRAVQMGGEAKAAVVAEKMKTSKRTLDRMFEEKESLLVPPSDGCRALRLIRSKGRIFGNEITEDGSASLKKISPGGDDAAGRDRDKSETSKDMTRS
jgi:hypothetical protein